MFLILIAIIFDPSKTLYSARESGVTLFSTILALRYSWVHICTPNYCYVASDIEISINKAFYFASTLNVSDIEPDNRHVQLEGHFHNLRF